MDRTSHHITSQPPGWSHSIVFSATVMVLLLVLWELMLEVVAEWESQCSQSYFHQSPALAAARQDKARPRNVLVNFLTARERDSVGAARALSGEAGVVLASTINPVLSLCAGTSLSPAREQVSRNYLFIPTRPERGLQLQKKD